MPLAKTGWTGGGSAQTNTSTFDCALQSGTADKLLAVACDGVNRGIVLPSPWVTLGAELDTGPSNAASCILAYIAGSSDTTVQASIPVGAEQWAWVTCNFSDTDFSTVPPVVGTAVADGNANPPALDLITTAETIWIPVVFNDDGRRNAAVDGQPSGFGNLFVATNGSSASVSISIADLISTAQSIDPGAFTMTGGTNDGAQTIGIRAAGGAPPVSGLVSHNLLHVGV